jgi:hypothetical protein
MRPLARLVTAFAVAVTLSAEASHAAPGTG